MEREGAEALLHHGHKQVEAVQLPASRENLHLSEVRLVCNNATQACRHTTCSQLALDAWRDGLGALQASCGFGYHFQRMASGCTGSMLATWQGRIVVCLGTKQKLKLKAISCQQLQSPAHLFTTFIPL